MTDFTFSADMGKIGFRPLRHIRRDLSRRIATVELRAARSGRVAVATSASDGLAERYELVAFELGVAYMVKFVLVFKVTFRN